jgi:hypothetical protein
MSHEMFQIITNKSYVDNYSTVSHDTHFFLIQNLRKYEAL